MSDAYFHSEIAMAPPLRAAASAPSPRFESQAVWGARRFESATTDRLNQSHWQYADDQSVNVWLLEQLAIVRARANYEARQNGTVLGVINTHADDVAGPDGPTLQVLSDDEAYNSALESLWVEWFKAPTYKPNISGAQWLKLCIRSLWKNGEYIARLITDPSAEGPVTLRLKPIHPRRLATPMDLTGDPNVFMGIRLDALGRPARYYISAATASGAPTLAINNPDIVPPDLLIHEFIAEEEEQLRGIPWANTSLQPSADLRDYDDQIQDAARQIADQSALLYTEHPDAQVWTNPESTSVERRTIKMVPPGWKPFTYPATMPPVQYPEYRGERQREIGRPQGMPLLMIRLDSSKHNYSSARLDTQTYGRAVSGLQYWISGTEQSYGTLNRLVDAIAQEARFSDPALRRRPRVVKYKWTWPTRPHVDPAKEALAEATSLENRTLTLTDALAARGKSLEAHIATLQRERDLLEEAGLPIPAWLKEEQATARDSLTKLVDEEDAAEAAAAAASEKSGSQSTNAPAKETANA
ncbi:MAG: phage portal protein [Patescibacteria group bacterium]